MGATIKAARAALAAVQVLRGLNGSELNSAQRATLERFPGWGAVAPLFDAQPEPSWVALADEVDDLVPAEMKIAARVVDTSFYTPPALVEHIYRLLRGAGLTGGPVLDLGCGTGRFFRHAPADLPIEFTGVEVDPIAAGIASALHPTAHIITDRLQRVSLPNGRFSAAVGNVPFSSSNVSDPAIGFYGALHDYFLVRAARAVHPGGYVVMVTSRHTLDSTSGLPYSVRDLADLLAAIRLPSGYFSREGTEVVADVLVLRVRERDGQRQGWDGQCEYLAGKDPQGRSAHARISGFWAEHRDLVAGTI
jgi:SAM-dependent methyltransferase